MTTTTDAVLDAMTDAIAVRIGLFFDTEQCRLIAREALAAARTISHCGCVLDPGCRWHASVVGAEAAARAVPRREPEGPET